MMSPNDPAPGESRISVVIPTRNPNWDRLLEVLRALRVQTLPAGKWDVCIVDNGSTPPIDAARLTASCNCTVVRESVPGLLAARLRGIDATRGQYLVFIDDDTVPSADFLAAATRFMDANPTVGTAGGRILPRYAVPPPSWISSVEWILALRDNGPDALEWDIDAGTAFPNWTPIGAGLLARRSALVPAYLRHVESHRAVIEQISWHGQGSGGVEDKDLVLFTLRSGWATAYIPTMELTHIIPEVRLKQAYFEHLIPQVQKMWVMTLRAHGFDLYPAIHPATLTLRVVKAWFAFKAWRSPAHRMRWLATVGYLRGLAACWNGIERYAATEGPT